MTDTGMLLDHDLLIGLRAEMVSVRQSIEMHNIASVERDTRLAEQVTRINGSIANHEQGLTLLMADRSIWSWVIRACVVTTPVAIVVANYLTAK